MKLAGDVRRQFVELCGESHVHGLQLVLLEVFGVVAVQLHVHRLRAVEDLFLKHEVLEVIAILLVDVGIICPQLELWLVGVILHDVVLLCQ